MLPDGVSLHRLQPHPDERGVFTELFRVSWAMPVTPVQWNVVTSETNVLRGVHAHVLHVDYLTVIAGRATIALYDLRDGSPTDGHVTTLELSGRDPQAIIIPTGVAHGFYFHEPSLHIYSVTREWDPADELGCRWDDADLRIDWPCAQPVVSERDREAPSLATLRSAWRQAHAPV